LEKNNHKNEIRIQKRKKMLIDQNKLKYIPGVYAKKKTRTFTDAAQNNLADYSIAMSIGDIAPKLKVTG